jgi:hypothetical protein
MRIQVECYAGYRGEETPRAIVIGGRRVAISSVLDRWLSPDHSYFKCLGDDGGIYIIRNDVAGVRWELTFFSEDRQAPLKDDGSSGTA